MKRLTPWLLAAIALAGCAKSTTRPTAKMKGPTGVALFRGYSTDAPGTLRQLVAVSNTRGDDLRVIDALTNQVLLGPTLVAALAIPTESRPTLIAAGRLDDLDDAGTGVAARPDLLVVAPRGLVARPNQPGRFAAAIQVVVTWDPAMRVDRTIDLGDVAPDATITALAVIPEAQPDGSRLPGTARVVIGLSDGGLLTIQATRATGTEAIVLGDPSRLDLGITRQDLAFTPLDLAFPPYDLAFPAADPAPVPGWNKLYVATTNPIPGPGGAFGVAELDVSGTPGAWPVRAIPGRIGTTRVAALGVAPFLDNDPNAAIPDFDQFGPVVPRVYASVDLRACGRDRSMPCGVAVLDPVAGGLAADPAGELPYQLPFQVDGEVVALAVSGPPQESDRPGYLQLAPASGRRWTQSMGAISSSVGRIYIANLSHFALANDVSTLVGSSRARVISASSIVPSLTSNTIGVWQWLIPKDPNATWPLYIDTYAVFGIGVTPGYTPNDDWSVTYQGVLPGLGSRLAVARVPAGASQPPTQVALQQATGLTEPGTSPWRSVVRVYDPRLAIQPYDIVEVSGFESGVCPRGKFEMVVTGLLPPTADAPGGAIALAPAGSQPTNDGQVLPADPACLPGGDSPVTVTVRAWGYVLLGSRTGYGGTAPGGPGPARRHAGLRAEVRERGPALLPHHAGPAGRLAAGGRRRGGLRGRRGHLPGDLRAAHPGPPGPAALLRHQPVRRHPRADLLQHLGRAGAHRQRRAPAAPAAPPARLPPADRAGGGLQAGGQARRRRLRSARARGLPGVLHRERLRAELPGALQRHERDRRRPAGAGAPLRPDRGHRAGDRRHPRLRRLRRQPRARVRLGLVGPELHHHSLTAVAASCERRGHESPAPGAADSRRPLGAAR